jgi:hypothetical protein
MEKRKGNKNNFFAKLPFLYILPRVCLLHLQVLESSEARLCTRLDSRFNFFIFFILHIPQNPLAHTMLPVGVWVV